MGIRESLLNTITSVSNGDFIRVVTSAGVSSKATVQNLFKSFETGLGAKSSLTTSDYIRVVGSDNVLYKQSVSDVADKVLTLGKSASTAGTVSDLDALVPFTTGYATFDASVSPTGASSAFWYSVIGWGSNTRTEITCVDVSGTVYTKVKDYSGWKAWVKQPTRTEMDALNSITSSTLTVASGWTATANWCVKRNGICQMYVELTNGTYSTGWTTVATLPEGFRPQWAFDALAINNGSNEEPAVSMKIQATGAVSIYKLSNTTNNIRLSATFICA